MAYVKGLGAIRVKSLFKSIDVLQALSQVPDAQAGVTELARATGIDKVIVHRILQTFVARDLVEQDPDTRKYRLGSGLVSLAGRRLAATRVLELANRYLMELWEACGETVTVSRPLANEIVLLRVIESRQVVRASAEMGERAPLHTTASGRLFLALGDPVWREQVLSGPLPATTPKTITTREALETELETIARQGYSIDRESTMIDVVAIAAPILAKGQAIGAVVVIGPASRLKGKRVNETVERVCEAARLITAEVASRDIRHL